MRAVVCSQFGGLDNLKLGTMVDPKPNAGEVVIEVRAAGLNFPDLLVVAGKYQAKPELPFAPGGECAGVIAELGEDVSGFEVGDWVVGMGLIGALAERMVVPAASVLPMPKGMDFTTAAGIAVTYGTSYFALKQRAKLQAGETLLVLGAAGGVGTAAVQLGKTMGATVIAAASSQEKLKAARFAGADLAIDYSKEPLKLRIKELTLKGGANVIYDPVGGDYSEQALRGIAWDGRYLVVGFAAGSIPEIPLNLALLKSANLIGVFWGTWTQREPKASAENFAELWKMFEDGTLKPRITTFPLQDFRFAFDALAERQAIGKIVCQVS